MWQYRLSPLMLGRLVHSNWLVNRSLKKHGLCSTLQSIPTDRRRPAGSQPALEDRLHLMLRAYFSFRQLRDQGRDDFLARSLALALALRRLRIDATVCFGVRKFPFLAHAWVEAGTMVVNERVDTDSRGTPCSRRGLAGRDFADLRLRCAIWPASRSGARRSGASRPVRADRTGTELPDHGEAPARHSRSRARPSIDRHGGHGRRLRGPGRQPGRDCQPPGRIPAANRHRRRRPGECVSRVGRPVRLERDRRVSGSPSSTGARGVWSPRGTASASATCFATTTARASGSPRTWTCC